MRNIKIPWIYPAIQRFRSSEFAFGTALAISVGILAGLGAVAFRRLIELVQLILFDHGATVLSFMGQYYVILIPVIGGLVIGPLIHFTGVWYN